ncbi:flagellar type III secretion system pore protein FliP [Parachitinimonas caeni]|uniref:Flagellar biosynthetic protein FliP n=1 Tax=Parachitinimonas caeni TaxID=3031301 RepID=A0ABT7DYJ4_9NEIS|nr:flagellar type III secretion system pore protein FliP [Parachitinimonas caeni]MDK2125134.1 flagellar type III secretion system pore protein FliP [Parachitinimonas caeni]
MFRLNRGNRPLAILGCLLLMCIPMALAASSTSLGGIELKVSGGPEGPEQVSAAIKVLVAMTLLSLVPAFLVSITSFVRITIVLSMLRHALGMQETPPNSVLLSLSLFLTLFTMSPALTEANKTAFQPYMAGKINTDAALQQGIKPFREFMIRQTREQDLALMIEMSHAPEPKTIDEVGNIQLIPAFMLSELRTAFQIGFFVFLPFLLVDLIVSAILMSLGMMMVPPTSIALPIKILMFILIDGWSLIVRALLGTFA